MEVASVAILVTAIFVTHVADGLYLGLGRTPPDTLEPLSALALIACVWAWFAAYSARHGIRWPLDLGCFLAIAWPFLLPYYVLRTEGRRGWGRIGLFCFTYFTAWLVGVAITIWCRVLSGEPF